jgi:RNA polymerase sigma-B factor
MTNVATARSRRDSLLLERYLAKPSRRATADLVDQYLPLARTLAGRYRGGQEPFEDLVQVASLGLIKAIRGFDPQRKTSFNAYAVPTILGELRRHFRDKVWNLRLPRSLQESTIAVDRAVDRLHGTLGPQPSIGELANGTQFSEQRVLDSLVAGSARWPTSIDAPVGHDSDEPISTHDRIGFDDRGYDGAEADAACAATNIEPREREALELTYGAGLTQAEAGSRLGCSQMQVSRLSRRALKKLLAAVQGRDWVPGPA